MALVNMDVLAAHSPPGELTEPRSKLVDSSDNFG